MHSAPSFFPSSVRSDWTHHWSPRCFIPKQLLGPECTCLGWWEFLPQSGRPATLAGGPSKPAAFQRACEKTTHTHTVTGWEVQSLHQVHLAVVLPFPFCFVCFLPFQEWFQKISSKQICSDSLKLSAEGEREELRTLLLGPLLFSPQILVSLLIFSHQPCPLSPWIIHLPLLLLFDPFHQKWQDPAGTPCPSPSPGSEQWQREEFGPLPTSLPFTAFLGRSPVVPEATEGQTGVLLRACPCGSPHCRANQRALCRPVSVSRKAVS